APPGLRPAPSVGFFDAAETCGIIGSIPQEAHEIAHGGMAEPEHQRVAAGIDQLIDPARLEAAGDVDMYIRRDQRLLGALVVEANPAFDAGKAPALGQHRDRRVVGIAAAREVSLPRVEGYGGMAARR